MPIGGWGVDPFGWGNGSAPGPVTGGVGGGNWFKGPTNAKGRPYGASSNDFGSAGMSMGGGGRNLQGTFQNNFDKQTHGSRDFYNDYKDIAQEQYDKTRGLLGQQKGYDADYLNNLQQGIQNNNLNQDSYLKQYTNKAESTARESEAQSTDARQTYTGTLRPQMKQNMENLGREAGNAMTLQQAGDPNNAINQGWRDAYNKEAKGVRNQGMQDAGMLNALGAQAFGNSMGNMPMTGAQMQMGQAQALQQGSQAYAGAQRQMNRLREMGMDVGREESANQYARGEGARDRYAQSQRDFSGAEDAYTNRAGALRGERMGMYADINSAKSQREADRFNLGQGQREAQHGMASDRLAGDLAAVGDLYGSRLQGKGLQYQGNQAQQGGMMGAAGKALPFILA